MFEYCQSTKIWAKQAEKVNWEGKEYSEAVNRMHRSLKRTLTKNCMNVFQESVLELLQQEPATSKVDHPPADDEILKVVNSLMNNAHGESGLSSQMFKSIVSTNQTCELLKKKNVILDFWGI